MSSTNGQPGTPALELRDLDVVYRVRGSDRKVLRSVSLRIERGESYGSNTYE